MKLKIKVSPNSKEQKIDKISDDEYVVKLKSEAREGKANLELVKLLKKEFKKDVRIVHGFNSKNKLVEVRNS